MGILSWLKTIQDIPSYHEAPFSRNQLVNNMLTYC